MQLDSPRWVTSCKKKKKKPPYAHFVCIASLHRHFKYCRGVSVIQMMLDTQAFCWEIKSFFWLLSWIYSDSNLEYTATATLTCDQQACTNAVSLVPKGSDVEKKSGFFLGGAGLRPNLTVTVILNTSIQTFEWHSTSEMCTRVPRSVAKDSTVQKICNEQTSRVGRREWGLKKQQAKPGAQQVMT